jgi:hypothetical protein
LEKYSNQAKVREFSLTINYNDFESIVFRIFSSSILEYFDNQDLLEDKIYDILALDRLEETNFAEFIK